MSLPVLLTGTIDSGVYNNTGNIITDVKERLSQYETSIERYITETDFDKIVFIENSGYNFDEMKYFNLAREYGKQFEFIRGTVCKDEIAKHGKSYGDAFLIHEGLKKSHLLVNEQFFYKMTGRIFLTNSKKIVKTAIKHRNEFIVYPGIHWCLTYCFKANIHDYLQFLDDIFTECDESSVRDIEISFYYRLKEAYENGFLSVNSFSAFPVVEGKMGATGRNYSDGKFKQLILSFCARIGVFTFNSFPSVLFWKIYGILKKSKGY